MGDQSIGSGAYNPLGLLLSLGAPPSAIGHAGEQIVVGHLQRAGYSGNWDTRLAGSSDIEAWGGARHLLIQVKSALYPNSPPYVSVTEERNIKARASRIGAEAWEARVQVGAMLAQLGEIGWRRLGP